jgi:hypothetical protein
VRALSLFLGLILIGCSSVVSPFGVLVSFLSEEVWDESSRVRVSCLTQNLGCEPLFIIFGV